MQASDRGPTLVFIFLIVTKYLEMKCTYNKNNPFDLCWNKRRLSWKTNLPPRNFCLCRECFLFCSKSHFISLSGLQPWSHLSHPFVSWIFILSVFMYPIKALAHFDSYSSFHPVLHGSMKWLRESYLWCSFVVFTHILLTISRTTILRHTSFLRLPSSSRS